MSEELFAKALKNTFSNTKGDLIYLIEHGYIRYHSRRLKQVEGQWVPGEWHDYSVLKAVTWGNKMRDPNDYHSFIRSKICVK